MSLVVEIFSSLRHPRKTIKKQLDAEVSEERNLFFVMFFAVMSLLAQLPTIAIEARSSEESFANLTALKLASFIFVTPLVLYGIAFIFNQAMRFFGGHANGAQARRVLFWAAVTSIPFLLLSGLINGLGAEKYAVIISIVTVLVFLWQWGIGMHEAEFSIQKQE